MDLNPYKFIASSADPLMRKTAVEWIRAQEMEPSAGWAVAVRVLGENDTYGSLELGTGDVVKLKAGDTFVGVLGDRRASKAYGGRVPASLSTGDVLTMLNLGGVIGQLESDYEELRAPIPVEVLSVATLHGIPLSIRDAGLPLRSSFTQPIPLVAICGTAMDVGKTTAATRLIAELAGLGFEVYAAKAAGVACLKDVHAYKKAGAREALSFLDCGFPSTVGVKNIAPILKGLFSHMGEESSFSSKAIGVVELGDGLLGHYGSIQFFLDPEIRENLTACVLCAADWVGVYGAREILKLFGIRDLFVTGLVANSGVGSPLLRLPFCNVMKEPELLANWVVERLIPKPFPARGVRLWRSSIEPGS